MAQPTDDISMALFCDFENIALGAREAQYDKFDIKPVLERLLLKGSIVVKKAYCDWERYKSFKATMHEANFELIEIPHVRQSGKNSADIRMVVDALDLCYTKSHVNTFVIISGDSDFSPLVSKLRENAKRVIGVGVKHSTSDLLIANCDEFIYYDDLVRKRQQKEGGDRQNRKALDPQELEAHRTKGIAMAVATLDALLEDRADDERVWASVVKEALKRRHPGFNEAYHGFKSFGALLEEAHKRGLLEFGRENNNAFVKRRPAGAAPLAVEAPTEPLAAETAVAASAAEPAGAVPPAPTISETPAAEEPATAKPARGRGGRGRKPKAAAAAPQAAAPAAVGEEAPAVAEAVAEPAPVEPAAAKPARKPRSPSRAPRKKAATKKAAA
jgi:uncharacterized LabA/DUF88 family protein